MTLDRSFATDLDMFEKFKEERRDVIFDTTHYSCLVGRITENGASFLKLEDVKKCPSSFNNYSFDVFPLNYSKITDIINEKKMTSLYLNKSQIEAFKPFDEAINEYNEFKEEE